MIAPSPPPNNSRKQNSRKPVAVTVPARRRSLLSRSRRGAARVAAWACDPQLAPVLAIGFTIAHAVLWTAILTQIKAAQNVHFDVSEAYAWGQKALLGYGKHPPLSGWIAGAWFSLFPAADWAAYALAMATVGIGMVACWAIACRVAGRRRAFYVLVMVALYPIFNFKGFKYNADLVQLISLPLLVLAYLHAFEKRTIRSGVLLGLAAALALMCKYWVATMIGAIGLAALMHPKRMLFLRSPAPWMALVTMAAAMLPHLQWLRDADFAPFRYATDTYVISSHWESLRLVGAYLAHNIALLLLPLAIGAAVLGWAPRWWTLVLRDPRAFFARPWSLRDNPAIDRDQALNIRLIQAIVALGPPIGALILDIYIKTDWGIPLFFLVPLTVIAIPSLRVPRVALPRIAAIWLLSSLAVLAAAPQINIASMPRDANGNFTHVSYAQLARELTELWHTRFHTRWSVAAGYIEAAGEMTFYSVDHPMPMTPHDQDMPSGLVSLQDARRDGFIGVCEAADPRFDQCRAWMKDTAPDAERMVMTTRHFFNGSASAPSKWEVYLVPPGKS